MSMISEQIEELRLMAEMFANGEPYGNLLRRAANTIEMLSEKAREPKQGEWIPCSERLPANDDWVIISILDETGDTPYRYSDFGWYLEAAKCWIVESEQRTDVVAWMPLPEPWKGADDERL